MLAACGKENHTSHAPNGDLREETASADTLPAFLKTKGEQVRLAYQVAGKLGDTLQWIPCYCGCGESAGHGSNLNCFIHEIRDDGTVEWDDHGTRCGVCVQIALTTAQMKQQGSTDLEIRQYVDEKYGNGFAKPTDTPMPKA